MHVHAWQEAVDEGMACVKYLRYRGFEQKEPVLQVGAFAQQLVKLAIYSPLFCSDFMGESVYVCECKWDGSVLRRVASCHVDGPMNWLRAW
eukprot:601563-Pelagomonas_calceolata.AAC.1